MIDYGIYYNYSIQAWFYRNISDVGVVSTVSTSLYVANCIENYLYSLIISRNHGEMDAREIVQIIGFSGPGYLGPVSTVDNENL